MYVVARRIEDLSFTHGACKQYNQHPSLAHRTHPRLVTGSTFDTKCLWKTHSSFQCRCYRFCFFIQGCHNPRFWTCATYLTIVLSVLPCFTHQITSNQTSLILSSPNWGQGESFAWIVQDTNWEVFHTSHFLQTSPHGSKLHLLRGLQWMSPVTSQKQVDETHYSKSLKAVYSKPPLQFVWLFDV